MPRRYTSGTSLSATVLRHTGLLISTWGRHPLTKTKTINLALQGGGAHGAFTWGVLDHLLGDTRLVIGAISAASAGAINAVALAAGLAEGGRAGAKAKLAEVWRAIHSARVPDLIRFNPFFASMASSTNVAQVFSPYTFNPMGFDPLRRVLSDRIDFAKVRAAPVELMIAATDIETGRARYFTRSEMTIEAVLASACLPTLHHAVEIDGRAYWDGGFSANPGLVELVKGSSTSDTLIVLLNPTTKSGIPVSAEEIANETGRLTFNAPFLRDVAVIEAVRESLPRGLARSLGSKSHHLRLVSHHFHLIEAGRHTRALPAGSKMKPDWGLFTYLHEAGRTEAYKWADTAYADIGKRSTVDLKARFLADPLLMPHHEVRLAARATSSPPPQKSLKG